MFGLKIIKKSDYDQLLSRIKLLETQIISKDREINLCEGQINDLIEQVKVLESELNGYKHPANLLVDTASTPLVQEMKETKTSQKRTKTVKNTETKSTKQKPRTVVRKKSEK